VGYVAQVPLQTGFTLKTRSATSSSNIPSSIPAEELAITSRQRESALQGPANLRRRYRDPSVQSGLPAAGQNRLQCCL
jgi:hypothetical protein